jgi:hypothetical protein
MKKIYGVVILPVILFLTGCTPTVSISLIESDDNIEVYEHHVVRGCTLTIDGVDYAMRISENEVNTDVIGTYSINYEYDIKETTYVCTRTVFVTDQIAPVLELKPGVDTITANSEWVDGGINIIDNYDTDNFTIEINNTVDTSQLGEYVVSYTVTDSSNNESTIERIVTVIE